MSDIHFGSACSLTTDNVRRTFDEHVTILSLSSKKSVTAEAENGLLKEGNASCSVGRLCSPHFVVVTFLLTGTPGTAGKALMTSPSSPDAPVPLDLPAAPEDAWKSLTLSRVNNQIWAVTQDEHADPLYTIRCAKIPLIRPLFTQRSNDPDVVVTRGNALGRTVGFCRVRRIPLLEPVALGYYTYDADGDEHLLGIVKAAMLTGRWTEQWFGSERGLKGLRWAWKVRPLPTPGWELLDEEGNAVARYRSVWGSKLLGNLTFNSVIEASFRDEVFAQFVPIMYVSVVISPSGAGRDFEARYTVCLKQVSD
ncbi:hypothetical protein AAVH_22045 [Aphelenchoides avenae]|nr:hypothetical protein AAVH_22045 [Aphelenchus avenae]